jgi:predicted ATPase
MAVGDFGVVPLPLRGRSAEFGLLEEHFRAAGDGRGGVALIEGPAGIGKSRLLTEAVATAADQGMAVAIASPGEPDQLAPLALLFRVAGQSVRSPPTAVVDAALWRLEQLRFGLEERTVRSSLVLALDDLHLADLATLLAVETLAIELASYPLLWLLAGRRDRPGSPVDRLFASLRDNLDAARIQLQPLPAEAVSAVIGDVLGAKPDAGILRLAEGANGNPLLVVELVQGLRDDGAIKRTRGLARLAAAQPPQGRDTILGRHIPGLSTHAADVLDVVAVFGPSFSVGDVVDVMGEPTGDILPLLEEAVRSGILVATSDAFVFRHESIRELVYQRISPAVRLALHRGIGAVLLDRRPSAVPAAAHLIQGARQGDHQALAGLDQATRELLASSPQSAAELALRGLVDGGKTAGRSARCPTPAPSCATKAVEEERAQAAAGEAGQAWLGSSDGSSSDVRPGSDEDR